MLQLDLPVPSTSSSANSHQSSSGYDSAPLDCSKRATEAESTAAVPSTPIKRKKISYAIEDLLKKDDS